MSISKKDERLIRLLNTWLNQNETELTNNQFISVSDTILIIAGEK